MSEEVSKIIDMLCEKFGTAANTLIPEMAKYHIATSAFATIMGLLMMVVGAVIFPKCRQYDVKGKGDSMFVVIPIVVFAIGFMTFCFMCSDLIGWIASPMGSTIDYILTRMSASNG